MNPVNITINIQATPDGVTVTQAQQADVLEMSNAPGPTELDDLEAAMESIQADAAAPAPTETEASAILDDATEAPIPSPLEELDDLAGTG